MALDPMLDPEDYLDQFKLEVLDIVQACRDHRAQLEAQAQAVLNGASQSERAALLERAQHLKSTLEQASKMLSSLS